MSMNSIKTHELVAVKDESRKRGNDIFFYTICARAAGGANEPVGSVELLLTEVEERGGKNLETHGMFLVKYFCPPDGYMFEYLMKRDYGKDWKNRIDSHMEKHLVGMACELLDQRRTESLTREYTPSQFLMGMGFPFAVEKADGEDIREGGEYAVVSHDHKPICMLPCLAQALLVRNALNAYGQPYTF